MELRRINIRLISSLQGALSRLPLAGVELLILPTLIIYFKWENWVTLGDCSYYTLSGLEILAGKNPYLGDAKWGSFSAIIMFLLFGWYPKFIASALLLGINFAGIYKFSRIQGVKPGPAYALSLIACITSVNRENLINGQITGLILLAIASAQILNSNNRYPLLGAGLTLFALEMKPQVSIPLILFLWKKEDLHWKRILIFAIPVHAAINLYNGRFLERDFLSQILKTSTTNPHNTWENTSNLLPILDQAIGNASYTKSTGILIVLLSCIYLARRQRFKVIYPLFLTALFMPYIHLYDLLGITIICLAKMYKNRTLSGVQILALLVVLSPLRTLSFENLALTAILLAALISTLSIKVEKYFTPHIAAYLLFIPNVIPYFRPDSNVILNSWITTSVLIALAVLIYKPKDVEQSAKTAK